MDERIEGLIMDYLSGTLSADDKIEFNNLLNSGDIRKEDLETYAALFEGLDNSDQPLVSEKLSQNFYSMLDEKGKAANKSTILDQLAAYLTNQGLSRGGLQAAYSLVVLILGLGVGYLVMGKDDKSEITALSSEVKEMKAMMMLNLLEKESPSARIKAVNLTENMKDVDEEIINALFSTLTNDNSTNVRLEALDALVRYADRPAVRVGLIESLTLQTSPLVQLGLADIMVLLQDKNAKVALEEMLEKEDLTEDVRLVIKERINSINI